MPIDAGLTGGPGIVVMSHRLPWRSEMPPRRRKAFRRWYALALVVTATVLAARLAAVVLSYANTEGATATAVARVSFDGRQAERSSGFLNWWPDPNVSLRFETRDGRVVTVDHFELSDRRSHLLIGTELRIRYRKRFPQFGAVEEDHGSALIDVTLVVVGAWLLLPGLVRSALGQPLILWPPWPMRP